MLTSNHGHDSYVLEKGEGWEERVQNIETLLELSEPPFSMSFNECLKSCGVKNPPAGFQIILKLLLINWSGPLDQLGKLIWKLQEKKVHEHGLDHTKFWFDLEFFPICWKEAATVL